MADEFEMADLTTEAGTFRVIAKKAELDALISGGRVPSWLSYQIVPDRKDGPFHTVQVPTVRVVHIVRERAQEGEAS